MSKLILTCELELCSSHSGHSGRSTVARMDWVPSYFGSRNGHAGSPGGEMAFFGLLSGRGIEWHRHGKSMQIMAAGWWKILFLNGRELKRLRIVYKLITWEIENRYVWSPQDRQNVRRWVEEKLFDFGGFDKLWKIDQVSIDIHLGFQKMLTVKELTRALMFLIGV